MSTIFPTDFFVNNRAKLRTLFMGTAPIVLSANGVLQQNGDNTYPFRQDSSFWYFTGIDEPGVILVIDKNKEYLILPTLTHSTELFDGAFDLEELAKISGINQILDEQAGWKQLGDRLKRAKHSAILPSPGAYIESHNFYSNPARARMLAKMKTYNSNLEFLDIRSHITKLRSIKQPIEIAAIKSAIDVTTRTLKKIQRGMSKFQYEYEIDALILHEFRLANTQPAFTSVVAAGENACTIHSHSYARINENDLVVVDMGAERENYAADITRTYASSAKISKRQKQVFESVQQVQQYAISLVKPGLILSEYESVIEHFMGEQLRELGLISTIETSAVRKYYTHRTSHFLGLDVHDIGDYEQPLEESMVITVEPGIYIPEEGIGIRLEDDIIVTPTSNLNLSANLPSNLF